jgi:hypothetical protein
MRPGMSFGMVLLIVAITSIIVNFYGEMKDNADQY